MRKVCLALLLSAVVWGANPAVFNGLGDPIYDGMARYRELLAIGSMQRYHQGIEAHLDACVAARAEGMMLESGHAVSDERRHYLELLRKLAVERRFFDEAVQKAFVQAMDEQSYAEFSRLVKTGLVDTDSKREEATAFYLRHRADDRIAVLEEYVSEDEAARARALGEEEARRAAAEREKRARIEQVRKRQLAAKKVQAKAIEEEARRQKEEAARAQEEELQKLR